MLMYLSALYDTDSCDDTAENPNYNAYNSDYCFHHLFPFAFIFHLHPLLRHGSSQNVLVLAKGEPRTVLVAPICIVYQTKFTHSIFYLIFIEVLFST